MAILCHSAFLTVCWSQGGQISQMEAQGFKNKHSNDEGRSYIISWPSLRSHAALFSLNIGRNSHNIIVSLYSKEDVAEFLKGTMFKITANGNCHYLHLIGQEIWAQKDVVLFSKNTHIIRGKARV